MLGAPTVAQCSVRAVSHPAHVSQSHRSPSEHDEAAAVCRGPEEADAESVRTAVLLDELDFPGALVAVWLQSHFLSCTTQHPQPVHALQHGMMRVIRVTLQPYFFCSGIWLCQAPLVFVGMTASASTSGAVLVHDSDGVIQ